MWVIETRSIDTASSIAVAPINEHTPNSSPSARSNQAVANGAIQCNLLASVPPPSICGLHLSAPRISDKISTTTQRVVRLVVRACVFTYAPAPGWSWHDGHEAGEPYEHPPPAPPPQHDCPSCLHMAMQLASHPQGIGGFGPSNVMVSSSNHASAKTLREAGYCTEQALVANVWSLPTHG